MKKKLIKLIIHRGKYTQFCSAKMFIRFKINFKPLVNNA